VWGDLFKRPVYGIVQSGKKREASNSRPELPHTQWQTALFLRRDVFVQIPPKLVSVVLAILDVIASDPGVWFRQQDVGFEQAGVVDFK
jgi:hypothetical protein